MHASIARRAVPTTRRARYRYHGYAGFATISIPTSTKSINIKKLGPAKGPDWSLS